MSIDLAGKNTAFKGRIRDISVGAAAVVLEKVDLLNYLTQGQEIENVQVSINKKTVYTKAVVLRCAPDPQNKNHILVFSYLNPNTNFLKMVVSYIYQKMQSEETKEAPFTLNNN